MNQQPPDAVSVRFFARMLKVNQLTVRWWIRRGWLPIYQLGPRMIRLDANDLRLLLKLVRECKENDDRPGVVLQRNQHLFHE